MTNTGGRLLIPSAVMALSVEDRQADQLMSELLACMSRPIESTPPRGTSPFQGGLTAAATAGSVPDPS